MEIFSRNRPLFVLTALWLLALGLSLGVAVVFRGGESSPPPKTARPDAVKRISLQQPPSSFFTARIASGTVDVIILK